MPDHLHPGVYLEEVPSGPRPIPGVSTSTAAFIATAAAGPLNAVSELLISVAGFEAVYGTNSGLLGQAVQAFFANGGQKLYVFRVAPANRSAMTAEDYARALALLEPIADISTVAAPGASLPGATGIASVGSIHAALTAHASRPQSYRFALLDPPPGCSISDIQTLRAQIDSSNAALYYPWINLQPNLANPVVPPSRAAASKVPPSGFVAGIFARVDSQQGVFKAPANQPILGAASLELTLSEADAATLNNAGINTLRTFTGRGILVWGARTVSSDSEWMYVNIRRYFNYLERSIDNGTQWAVFEPNGEQLWSNVRNAVSNFLFNEWKSSALQGSKPEDAYFVRCDRTTMTQNDLDNGRLVCLLGVAAVRPAEFIIFRIGQWTADAKPKP
jgi:uncharacterized protein